MIPHVLAVAAIAIYLYAVRTYRRRFPQRSFPAGRAALFIAGVLSMSAVLLPAADRLADRSLLAHMLQHLVLTLFGPPLVLLGAPLLLWIALIPASSGRRFARGLRFPLVHALSAPLLAWIVFVATLWIVHFSPLYEAALQNESIHGFEHALFVGTAMLFWMAVVQVGYTPRPLGFAVRIFYLFLALPQGAFLGLAILTAGRVLYPHYAVGRTFVQAIADQQAGGAAMWIGGGLALLSAILITAAVWASHERREAFA